MSGRTWRRYDGVECGARVLVHMPAQTTPERWIRDLKDRRLPEEMFRNPELGKLGVRVLLTSGQVSGGILWEHTAGQYVWSTEASSTWYPRSAELNGDVGCSCRELHRGIHPRRATKRAGHDAHATSGHCSEVSKELSKIPDATSLPCLSIRGDIQDLVLLQRAGVEAAWERPTGTALASLSPRAMWQTCDKSLEPFLMVAGETREVSHVHLNPSASRSSRKAFSSHRGMGALGGDSNHKLARW